MIPITKRWSPWKVRQFLNYKEGDDLPTWSDRDPSLFTSDLAYESWKQEYLNKKVPDFTDTNPLTIMGHKLKRSVFEINIVNIVQSPVDAAKQVLKHYDYGLTPELLVSLCNFYDPDRWLMEFRNYCLAVVEDERMAGSLGFETRGIMGSYVLPWVGRRAGKGDGRIVYPWPKLAKPGDSFSLPIAKVPGGFRSNIYNLAKRRGMRVKVHEDNEHDVYVVTRVA